jgi:cobalt-zinc-cadmium efflux system membrane fusion protein
MKNIILIIASSLTIVACTSRKEGPMPDRAQIHGDTVVLNAEQLRQTGITTTRAQYKTITSPLRAQGQIDAPPQFQNSVTVAYGGIVRSIVPLPGSRVKKGQILATLENPAYITMQQEYLTTSARLMAAEAEYTRQQRLARDTVVSRKNLEQSHAEVSALRAQRAALREQLALLWIDADNLTERTIVRTVKVPSPMDGTVTVIHVHSGAAVDASASIMEIVAQERLVGALSVFERDAWQLHVGQKVVLAPSGDSSHTHRGTISVIGGGVLQDRTIQVLCTIDPPFDDLRQGMTLMAVIETSPHQGWLVPSEAVVRDGNRTYVFTQGARGFVRHEVSVGAQGGATTEILGEPEWLRTSQVVVKGAHTLFGAMVATAEE